jgi:5-methylthioribose kinase
MIEVTATSAADYLRAAGRVAGDEPVNVRELPGGVSNVVLLVTLAERGERFIIKQARGRLRVKEDWCCPVQRIWREVETLQICGELLRLRIADCGLRIDGQTQTAGAAEIDASVPQIFWEDRDNYLYAMTAAPEDHKTWKESLLAGETVSGRDLAVTCGTLLAQLHSASWGNTEIAARLDDRTYFDLLRLDPYYRHVARVHSDLAPHLDALIDSVWQHRRCLVHGDFSPKNLLMWPGNVMLIDFEVGHYGDPAFDLGFFLTHLLLKSIWAAERRSEYLLLVQDFWRSYSQLMVAAVSGDDLKDLERRAVWNLAGCMLARVDGKSPVDYLSAEQQDVVRRLARCWMVDLPPSLESAAEVLRTQY